MLRFKNACAVMLSATLLLAGCGAGGNNNTPAANTQTQSDTATNDAPAENAPASTEKTKIEVWSWWGSEAKRPVMAHLIENFNETSETVEAEYIYTPYDDIFTKNLANIAAGTPADVMFGSLSDSVYRASQAQSENLSPLMERDNYPASQFFDTYMEGLRHDGAYYGLPFVVETRLMYFNKEHFRSVGVDPDDPDALPKTWDELIELARKLDIPNGSKYDRVGFLPLLGNGGWDLWIANADKGVAFYDPDSDKVVIDTPNKVKALERIMEVHTHYTDAVVDELQTAAGQGMQDPFGSGTVSITVNNPTYARAMNNDFPDLDYGTFLIPEFEPGSGHWANGGGFVIEIPKGAKKIDASWEFVKYMTSAYAQKYWSTNCFELSALKELMEDPELMSDRVYGTALKAAESTGSIFVPNNLYGWKDYLQPNLDMVQLRQMTPQDALTKAQSDLDNLMTRQSN